MPCHSFERTFRQFGCKTVLTEKDCEIFNRFAATISEMGLDWFCAEEAPCFGIKQLSSTKAAVRVGRLLVTEGLPLLVIASNTQSKRRSLDEHSKELTAFATWDDRNDRYLVPLEKFKRLFEIQGLMASLTEISGLRDGSGYWPCDYVRNTEVTLLDAGRSLIFEVRSDERKTGSDIPSVVLRRVGQALFRNDVVEHWSGCCAVHGVMPPSLLVASHITPWVQSGPDEKVSRDNGLSLSVPLDSLFDRGLISFADDGQMLISDLVTEAIKVAFGIGVSSLRIHSPEKITEKMKEHLACHRRRHGL